MTGPWCVSSCDLDSCQIVECQACTDPGLFGDMVNYARRFFAMKVPRGHGRRVQGGARCYKGYNWVGSGIGSMPERVQAPHNSCYCHR